MNKQLRGAVSILDRYQNWIIGLMGIGYAAVMSWVSMLRHRAFETHAFDLGIFDQAIWNTTRGAFLFSSLKENICLLGDHMSPILLAWVPFYLVWPDARVLLISQALLAALCLIPLTKIAEDRLGRGMGPLVFAMLFILYQPLRHSVRAEFHPELAANLIVLTAFWALWKGRSVLFWSMMALLVLCKENMYGISFAFGLYMIWLKKFKSGLLLMALSILFFLLTTQWWIPALSGGKYFYGGNFNYLFTGDWGDSPPLVAKPVEFLEYLIKIYVPLLGLSFFHPLTWIGTLPVLLQNVLSRNAMMHSIAFQYTAGLTPLVFISAVFGAEKLIDRFPKLKNLLWIGLVASSLALAGRPEWERAQGYLKQTDPSFAKIEKALQLPESHSVVASAHLVPHLSHRRYVRQFEDFARDGEALRRLGYDWVIIHDRKGNLDPKWDRLIRSAGYQVISTEGNPRFYLHSRKKMS